jgi:hypothetical protein
MRHRKVVDRVSRLRLARVNWRPILQCLTLGT